MAQKYDLKLKGFVGDWDFDPDYVDWFLGKNKDKSVTVVIDSLGGSVFSAMSVSANFKLHGNVHVHYVGYNASAATIASMGAKHISIDPHAMYLVHKCSTLVLKLARCNADELQELISGLDKERQTLERIDLNIATMYASRCKKSKEALLALMKEGGWLTAQEALDWGFVDEVCDLGCESNATINDSVVASMHEAGIPVPPGFEKQRMGLGRRVMEAVGQIFGITNSSNITTSMAKILTKICAALGIEELAFTDGYTSLTEEQMDTLEAAISERDTRITDLQAQVAAQAEQIANLQKEPAAETREVVNSGSDNTPDFLAIAKSAKEMFDSIP